MKFGHVIESIKNIFSYLSRYPFHILNDFSNLIKIIKKDIPVLYTDHIFGNIAHQARYKIGEMYSENIALINLLKDFDQLRIADNKTKVSFKSDSFDLFFMTNLIKKFKLKSIIEYGSGASTIAFADLLEKKIINKFISIESETKWKKSTEDCVKKLIPGISNNFEVSFSPISDARDFGYKNGCFYSLAPKEIFDFIYIDGPNLTNSKYKYSICPILVKQISINTIIFVDGRATTCKEIKKALINKNIYWKEFAVGFPSDDTIFINSKSKKYKLLVSAYSDFLLKKPSYY